MLPTPVGPVETLKKRKIRTFWVSHVVNPPIPALVGSRFSRTRYSSRASYCNIKVFIRSDEAG